MPIFVVHEHFDIQESSLMNVQWDLSLEIGGLLKSWALSDQPPRTKGIKRSAVQVEDRLRSYSNFQGELSSGQRRPGRVIIWDRGRFHLIEKTMNKIEFELKGLKLKGKYTLIKANHSDNSEPGWSFFKLEDI